MPLIKIYGHTDGIELDLEVKHDIAKCDAAIRIADNEIHIETREKTNFEVYGTIFTTLQVKTTEDASKTKQTNER